MHWINCGMPGTTSISEIQNIPSLTEKSLFEIGVGHLNTALEDILVQHRKPIIPPQVIWDALIG
ncbi:unnamed protein product, partial [Notodromas monacha]